MTPAQFRAALRIPAETPLWQALLLALDDAIDEAHAEAIEPNAHLKPHLAAYYAGAAAQLILFRNHLERQRAESMAKADEEP